VQSRLLLYCVFACSGAAALIYEITWTRLLALLFGHTTAAGSTVLAAFMGGLAVGAMLAGRLATRVSQAGALRAYAAIEILVALLALAVPVEIRALTPLLAAVYADGNGGLTFTLVRIACAFVIVLVPAAALGATLPLMVRWLAVTVDRAGRGIARLYAANTAGAAAGAIAAGFLLLPALGMQRTTLVAIALNLGSAAVAVWLSRRPGAPLPALSADTAPRTLVTSIEASPGRLRVAAIVAVGLSGAASLVLQVTWARILALAVGPTTYAFSAMVATFIAGIALGSLAAGAVTRRRSAAPTLAVALIASGLLAAAAAAWVPRVPLVVADAVVTASGGGDALLRTQVVVIIATMLPMTVAAGAALPLAVAVAARRDDVVPRDVATVYAANTIGAIAGAIAGGFLFVPAVGLQGSVGVAALLSVAAFVVVRGSALSIRRVVETAAIAAIAAVVVLWLPRWDRKLLSSGAYKYAAYLPAGEREPLLRAGMLHYYREGAAATVSVREVTGALALAIDGKVDATNAGDMLTQRLLAHLPLLLHPAPARVGIIGLGSGVTLGSALRHPIREAEVIEISPEVVVAAAFFRAENHDALADARTRLIVGDGRSHLVLGRATYDVLISEPSNPWMAGIAALFTREFFDAARDRLRPGGLFCQWAHTYDMSPDDLRSIVATFTSVFSHTSLWLVGDADVLLIGGMDPASARLDRIAEAWARPAVADDLAALDVRGPHALLSLFVAATPDLRAYAEGASIQRDDRLALEFTGPRQLHARQAGANVDVLRALAERADAPAIVDAARARPELFAARAAMLLRAEAYAAAFSLYLEALEHGTLDVGGMDGLLRSAAAAQKLDAAAAAIHRVRQIRPDDVVAAVGESRVLASRGQFEEAAGVFAAAPIAWRSDLRVLEQLASVFADAGNLPLLTTVLTEVQRVAPAHAVTRYYLAVRELAEGRPDEARRLVEGAVGEPSLASRAFTLLGAAHAGAGRRDNAMDAFRAAARADARDPTPYENLGRLALERGDSDGAIDAFAQALLLNPSSAVARQGLSQAAAVRR
jgi:spermidine synthase